MIEKSRWIEKFESELERRKVFCLYGSIDDDYFYKESTCNINEFFEKKFGDDLFIFFGTDYFEKIIESEEQQGEENDLTDGIFLNTRVDFLKNIQKLENLSEKNIIIKDPKLFFGDASCYDYSYTLRYFLEYINSEENDKKIIFISETLGDFPEKLTVNNPYVSTIYIDYPEEDERETYIKDILNFFSLREKTGEDSDSIKEDFNIFVKITGKRKLKEVSNIFQKAEETKTIFDSEKSIKDIVNDYDFGEKKSPWINLKNSTIKRLEEKLKKRVKGQNEAIEFVKKVIYRAKLNLNGVMQPYSTKPTGVMFFTGPSGVGKTELAKTLTECIFGDESSFKRFDMSEYKSAESINKLIGSDPGYVGYNEGGQLTNWIMSNPYSVILFDEIDKANVKIWDTFLQILEDGRLTDNKGNTGYFTESIIIFTSNIGNAEFDEIAEKNPKKHYLDALNKYFEKEVGRVEILNRFGDNKIVFNHISNDVFEEIIETKLEIVIKNMKKRIKNLELEIENIEEMKQFFMRKLETSKKFGARLVNTLIENYFINEFSIFYTEKNDNKNRIIAFVNDEKVEFRC
jgi:possible S14 family endopeptidase clpA